MKCKVCGKLFGLRRAKRYEIDKPRALADIFVNGTRRQVYECFDCPRCGCQNIVGIKECGVDYAEEENEEDDDL